MNESSFQLELLRDAQTIFDYWFAMCLIYAGYELVSIKQIGDRKFEYTVLCPRFDFEALKQEFTSGQMQIADARALGNTNSNLGRIVKDISRTGRDYLNPDYERLMEDR
jgi:hypothetical protein